MTSVGKALDLGWCIVAAAQVSASAATQPRLIPSCRRRHQRLAPQAGRPRARLTSATESTSSAAPSTAASASPSARSTKAGRPAGRTTSSIRSRASANCGCRSPPWTRSIAARVGLDDRVTLTASDLTLFHQPIARRDPAGRKLHDDARRPDDQGDHDQRQYRQRQADALGRRTRRRFAR